VPYRLPQLLAADPARTTFLVEGEKDADRVASLGLIATTNAGGAGKWTDVLSEHLRGHERVVILPDFDESGRRHAHLAADSVSRIVDDVRVVSLLGLPEHGDVSDWLDTGHTVGDLRRLVSVAPPIRGQRDRGVLRDRNWEFNDELDLSHCRASGPTNDALPETLIAMLADEGV